MATRRALPRLLALAALLAAVMAAPAWAQTADLVVSKSGPAQAAAGSDVTYTVTILNTGPDDSAAITLTDPIPGTMTFVSASPPGCTTPAMGSGGTVTCTIPGLTAFTSVDFTFVFHIPSGTAPGTVFVNSATASSATDDTAENNTGVAATETPPPPSADVGITKTAPSATAPDADFAFTIAIHNSGPDTAAGVTWTDTLPDNLTFVSLAPSSGAGLTCSTPSVGSGGTVSCTIAALAFDATQTFTLTVHVPAGTPSGTSYHNVATVSTTTADPNSENNSSSADVTVSTVDVSVAKQGPPTAVAGDTVAYALAVANGGPDTALNVNVFDTLPPNTTFVSFSHDTGPAPTSCSTPAAGGTGTVSCNYATLASGAQATFTLTVKVGDTTSITNTVSATTDSFDTAPGNNSATAGTTVDPRADVQITKSGPATVTAGNTITYTLTAIDNGPSTATSVSITDTLPAGTTFVSETQTTGPSFSCLTPAPGASGTITCTIGSLAANVPATFSIVLKVAPSTANGTSVVNTATISTTTVETDSGNNSSTTSTTVTTSADVGVTKTGPATATAGSNVQYPITVLNNGPSDATSVSLTDTLPAGTTFVSETQTTGPTFGCVTPAPGSGGTITCTLASLPAAASATFTVVVHVAPSTANGSSVVNTATVSTTTPDPNSGNDSSTTTATVAASADLSVTKTGPVTATAGTDVSYTITVGNAGPSDAAGVSLVDAVPAGTTFVSAMQATGPSFTCLPPPPDVTRTIIPLICTIASLAPGESATFTVVFHVVPTTAGPFTNTATVFSTTPDPSSGNNSASATTTTPGPADVSVTKTADGALGRVVTYTIVVTNHGPAGATSVVVTDAIPSGGTLNSATTTQGSCTGTTTVVCSLGSLAPNASATITLVVAFPNGGTFSNTATASTGSVDPNPGNNASTAQVTVSTAIPVLSMPTFALLALVLVVAGVVVLRRRPPARAR